MPDITASNVHHNQLLSDFSVAYRPENLIADQIFPVKNVSKQTNRYLVVDKAAWLRRPTTDRNPGSNPNDVHFSVSSDAYFADNRALGTWVDYETQDNADDPISALLPGVQFLRDQLAIDFECRVFTKLSSGVGSSQALTGTNAWTDYSNSDPITNIRTAKQAIYSTTGKYPNTFVIGQKAWDVIRFHPDLIQATHPGGGGGGIVAPDAFARVIEVDRVLIGRTIYNSAKEGQTATYTDVWSTNAYLLHVNQSPALNTATFGVAFHWTGAKIGRGGVGNYNIMTKEDERAGKTDLWTGYYQDEKVVAPELGFEIRTGV